MRNGVNSALTPRPHIRSVYRVILRGNHPCFVKIILTKNDNFDLTLRKRRFCNAKQPLLPCKTYAFGMQNNRFCNALIVRLLCDRYACEKYLHLYKHINIGDDSTLGDIYPFPIAASTNLFQSVSSIVKPLVDMFFHALCCAYPKQCILFSHCLNIAVWRKRVANCYLLQYIFCTFATRTRYFGFIPTR